MKKHINKILLSGVTLIAAMSCNVDPTFYSQVTPETFFTSQNAVYQRFNRPFTHWRYCWAGDWALTFWYLQEEGTDEFCTPTRGSDWYDAGTFQQFHHHDYGSYMIKIDDAWQYFGMGVALAWDAMEDLEEVNFDALGFEEGTRESLLSQLQVLVADFYLTGLDFFGGVPLYTTTKSEVKGRSTDVETFEFIDSLLTISIPNLPIKETLGAAETSQINRAAAAALKARLYFNAESYIGKAMYTEAAQICQDIIDGVYGKYELADDYRDIFGWGNENCTEIIWTIPSQNAKNESDEAGPWYPQVPYNYYMYLGGISAGESDNGPGLIPSRDPEGNIYPYKLGGAYEKFNDLDARKKNYYYDSNGNYEGIFIVGELINPKEPSWICYGAREYQGEPLVERDQVAYFSQVGDGPEFNYHSVSELESTIATAEENSCVRILKCGPEPDIYDQNMAGDPDIPHIRLTEIYYMLAECKMRAGDLDEAAKLINTVRKRNFFTETTLRGAKTYFDDPDPVTSGNLDMYRMLDEWLVEFLGEQRRRTDLVRWNAYVTEDWWDHIATNNPNLNRFPISYSALGTNQLLEQNPGY